MKKLFLIIICALIAGCGVRGDPLPPEVPVELGRGRPNYKRASESLNIDEDVLDEEEEKLPSSETNSEEEF